MLNATDPGNCDIVMKGGITSGVVYPRALEELSHAYRLKNIGGTSAGAIAAAAAAAAELGRGEENAGFERLGTLPDRLVKGDKLFSLFQPQRGTEALFRLATAGMGRVSQAEHAGRIFLAAISGYAVWILAGVVPGAYLLWLITQQPPSIARFVGFLVAGAIVIIGAALSFVAGVVRDVVVRVPANNYGLCKGFDKWEYLSSEGLISWLIDELDGLAGRQKGEPKPLTLGDLWGSDGAGQPLPEEKRKINLQMMTTNLTHGRPYSLPFIENVQNTFYFNADEMREYFPKGIVDWMVARSDENEEMTLEDGRTVHQMPKPRDMPVIVMTRLSLSFPGLFAAVPLYAVDFRSPEPSEGKRCPERCWFSDGGICSNLPLHFFDAIIPRWPTFAIDLRDFDRFRPRDPKHECNNIWVPKKNTQGLTPWWNRFDETFEGSSKNGLGSILGFVSAILDSARNWRENVQAHSPGYRDRIATVKLDGASEGGLNLRMEEEVIERLVERGRCAGAELRDRFDGAPQAGVDVGWPNHRWLRYRNAMNVIQQMLDELCTAFDYTFPDEPSYASLVTRATGTPPMSYPWRAPQNGVDQLAATEALLEVIRDWDTRGIDFEKGSPAPEPRLRVTPSV
jgi:predicted acylesterase/phospholipase RssA